jgi:pentatricopeptide repeat protein
MEQVFKSLQRSKERPTHPTFNSMITNYGKARLREKAEYVLDKMQELGFKPNYVTQECLIMMYAHCDCVSRARQVFDELVSSQNNVSLSSLNAMLEAYCLNGLHMEADRLLDTAIQKGLIPGGSTYKLLYKGYTKANNKDLVQKLLDRMNKQGIIPNKKFFLNAFEAFGTSKRKPRILPPANSASKPITDSSANSETATSSQPKVSKTLVAVQ